MKDNYMLPAECTQTISINEFESFGDKEKERYTPLKGIKGEVICYLYLILP